MPMVFGCRLETVLKEHIHTMRCQRREKTCTAQGAVREFERLGIRNKLQEQAQDTEAQYVTGVNG